MVLFPFTIQLIEIKPHPNLPRGFCKKLKNNKFYLQSTII